MRGEPVNRQGKCVCIGCANNYQGDRCEIRATTTIFDATGEDSSTEKKSSGTVIIAVVSVLVVGVGVAVFAVLVYIFMSRKRGQEHATPAAQNPAFDSRGERVYDETADNVNLANDPYEQPVAENPDHTEQCDSVDPIDACDTSSLGPPKPRTDLKPVRLQERHGRGNRVALSYMYGAPGAGGCDDEHCEVHRAPEERLEDEYEMPMYAAGGDQISSDYSALSGAVGLYLAGDEPDRLVYADKEASDYDSIDTGLPSERADLKQAVLEQQYGGTGISRTSRKGSVYDGFAVGSKA